jgi:hypothetical protein
MNNYSRVTRRVQSEPMSPQLHGERFYGKRHIDIYLHHALSPLFTRLTRIHDWFNDPVPHEERKEADGLDYRELMPETRARTWPRGVSKLDHRSQRLI